MQTHTSVACTVCGCVCDDLAVTVANGRVTQVRGACHLAEPWFLAQNASAPPAARLDGRPVEPGAAFARAADILRAARYPLVYGLSRSTTEAQRAAVALAEKLGGTIDTTASTGHAPSIVALQQVGESTCTLGEVKNRADLVVFWGSDPVVTHPYTTGVGVPAFALNRWIATMMAAHWPRPSRMLSRFASTTATIGAVRFTWLADRPNRKSHSPVRPSPDSTGK